MEEQKEYQSPPIESPDAFAEAHYKILAFTEGELTKRETAIKELHAALKVAVDAEMAKYNEACRAASYHNNTDGVGMHFDYMSAPPLPAWVERARAVLEKHNPELPF